MQTLLSSILLSKNIKIKVYRTTVFLLFCKGVKLGQNKKNHPVSTVNALSKLLTCNQTVKRKLRDNFNDIGECIL